MTTYDDAYKNAKNLKGGNQQDQLDFYAWAKVASGADFSAQPKPGAFAFEAKYKYKAWEDEVKKGTTKEQAQKAYVERYEKLKAEHGLKE